jgi:hypothetical protein
MLKYTIFKSKIIYKGEEGVGLTLKAWNEFAEKYGHFNKKNMEQLMQQNNSELK